MKRLFILTLIIMVAVSGMAQAFDLGTAALKLWEKKDAITKTAKALRKGFAELTDEEEYYIGRAVAANILGKYKQVKNAKLTTYINTLGLALANYSTRPETFGGYHFLLIKSKDVNAFAAPGGFIFITTGLYKKIKTEEQLAGVLSHEIAHVTLKHGLSAIKSSRLTEAFTILGTEAVKEYSSAQVGQLTELFEGTIDDVVNKMVVSGYSRSQEFDADGEALRIAYRAGYDPAGLAEFLDTLSKMKKHGGDKGFYKTHPPAGDRLAKVKDAIKDDGLKGEVSRARTKRFARFAAK